MKLLALRNEDDEQLREIWKVFYKDEFAFPDFYKHFLCAFKIVDKDDQIITAGGIRVLSEIVLMTDRGANQSARVKALFKALEFSKNTARAHRFDHIHATCIPNTSWERQLQKHNFEPIKDRMLILKDLGVTE